MYTRISITMTSSPSIFGFATVTRWLPSAGSVLPGHGKRIMVEGIKAAKEYFGATVIDIEAQEYAKGFYEQVGFRQSSGPFMLDGIPHIKMTYVMSHPEFSVKSDG